MCQTENVTMTFDQTSHVCETVQLKDADPHLVEELKKDENWITLTNSIDRNILVKKLQ